MYSVQSAVNGDAYWCRVGTDVCYFRNNLNRSIQVNILLLFSMTCSLLLLLLSGILSEFYTNKLSYSKFLLHTMVRVVYLLGRQLGLDVTSYRCMSYVCWFGLKYPSYKQIIYLKCLNEFKRLLHYLLYIITSLVWAMYSNI